MQIFQCLQNIILLQIHLKWIYIYKHVNFLPQQCSLYCLFCGTPQKRGDTIPKKSLTSPPSHRPQLPKLHIKPLCFWYEVWYHKFYLGTLTFSNFSADTLASTSVPQNPFTTQFLWGRVWALSLRISGFVTAKLKAIWQNNSSHMWISRRFPRLWHLCPKSPINPAIKSTN